MKYFLTRTFFFLIPIIAWFAIVVLIDPYNYLPKTTNLVDPQLKLDISYKLNYPLYKLIEYKKHPTQCILLGDSRTNSLDINVIKEYSNKEFSNLAYGGGTIKEIINTFWFVAKNADLKEVYIGVNFNLYNKYINRDRVTEASDIMSSFFSYALSSYTIKSTLMILKAKIFGIVTKIGVPNKSKDEFWNYQLNVSAKKYYVPYEYPDNYLLELKDISNYCHKKRIRLVFFIPPSHCDLQKKIADFNLQDFEQKFKYDLKELGELYDFDYPSDMTRDRSNFSDPFHTTKSVSRIIIKELFNKESDYSKK